MDPIYRAFAVLTRAAPDATLAAPRLLRGIASTPAPDRHGDVIEPLGMSFLNPVPLLWHHDKRAPVGTATFDPPTAAGLTFSAELPNLAEDGPLKTRIDEAWQTVAAGLIRGVSIGFRPLEFTELPNGSYRFVKSEVVELSLVTIPAQVEATILTVKQYAEAAPGPLTRSAPRALPRSAPRGAPMTIQEQITHWQNTRAPKVARMNELMALSASSGVTLDDPQSQEYDGLELEVREIDRHLQRCASAEQLAIASAVPAPRNPLPAAPDRSPARPIQVRALVPKGTAFVRAAMAVLQARGNRMEAVEIAKQWRDTTPEVEVFLKAAVLPGNTTDPAWAGALVTVQNVTSEFVELLRPATILGKIPNLREVPFNASVPVQTAGGSYGWVGQGAPKPVTKLGFGSATLGVAKASGIIVLTEELVRISNPSAEAIVRADMIAGIAAFLDQQFIDPAVAEVPNISPASITNGIAPIAGSGDPLADLHAIIAAFATANVPLGGLAVIMSETNAFTLGLIRDGAGGALLFPGMSAQGGTALGINIVASNAAGTNVIGVQPQMILLADEGAVQIDVSREASVQMDSAPTNPPDATVVLTSLWQNNLVGLRAERFINWKRGKVEAVKWVNNTTWAPAMASTRTMPTSTRSMSAAAK